MEEIYAGYFPKSKDQIKALWSDALFSFDANILLRLYERSDSSCNQILNTIDKLNNRVFLTHQAGLEYIRNRIGVISTQASRYSDSLNKLSGIVKKANAEDQPPFFSSGVNRALNNLLKRVEKESCEKIKLTEEKIQNDPIYDELGRIFKDKIGKGYNAEQLKKLYIQGEERFQNKIPPGFKDQNKEDNTQYGDFIIWHQIIDKAKETRKPIIFVTNDLKPDWWWIIKGKMFGPRPELTGEIKREANVDFYMYGLDQFLEESCLYFNKMIDDWTSKEVKYADNSYYKLPKSTSIKLEDEKCCYALRKKNRKPTMDKDSFHAGVSIRLTLSL